MLISPQWLKKEGVIFCLFARQEEGMRAGDSYKPINTRIWDSTHLARLFTS